MASISPHADQAGRPLRKPDGLWDVCHLWIPTGRTIWIIDARFDGKRFVVRADEKLTAFLKLEAAI